MDKTVSEFLQRNIPDFKDAFTVEFEKKSRDFFCITAQNGKIHVKANNYVSAFHGIYCYLKEYCNVQLSWCANQEIHISSLVMFDGEFHKEIEQKYRVYMNYCTLDYSMCWWDFERWEKEIDFMAMNGINMPLAVVGTEAVWYETLLQFGFTKKEALDFISGPAFWAWQLMTNIEGYLPPENEKYVYERLELGRKILQRYLEFGMYPIQQGFSGHVPVLLRKKYPKAKILMQNGWCRYPKTAQLDPLDPLFFEFGTVYLNKMNELLGNHHFIACDPFHEGTPPKSSRAYLNDVGKAINRLYENFDSESVWVMQAWTMRKHIVKAVPKNRLLILDLNSEKTPQNDNCWGYPVVSGMLHDFGGKNSMQGKLKQHSENAYLKLKNGGANVVGSGMFMEGIEQNPVVYDLQFELLTTAQAIDLDKWLDKYILRRYGKFDKTLRKAWEILLETCYRSDGYKENAVGSVVASRPQMIPTQAGPCCKNKLYYDTDKFEKAVELYLSVSEDFKESDGYQYDLCDLTRQAMSNRFHKEQIKFAAAYKKKNISAVEEIAKKQLSLLADMDTLLSHRKEFCFSRWINDCHNLATDEKEKRYFDMNARTLLTSWGDIRSTTWSLYDYAWREWSGLIKEYYYKRWKMFYNKVLYCLKNKKILFIINGDGYIGRFWYKSYPFGKKLNKFELSWLKDYKEYPEPKNSDVIGCVKKYAEKWGL
ncbi:MAG TPA: alpha-N-acetylglucosaminidase [Candidatus Eubacterium faecavium]|nr:alpha-N-acetylglucosaminidase [Candidatus Eubacterium faecavium]